MACFPLRHLSSIENKYVSTFTTVGSRWGPKCIRFPNRNQWGKFIPLRIEMEHILPGLCGQLQTHLLTWTGGAEGSETTGALC